MTDWRDRAGWIRPPLIYRAITHDQFAPRYFEPNHLTPGGIMVQLEICLSDGHASFTEFLHLDATSVIPPCAAPFLLGTFAQVLRPKPKNRPPGGFEAQPIKPPASSILHTRPSFLRNVSPPSSTARPPSLPEPPLDLHVCHLDSINTVTPMYTCACRCPHVSTTTVCRLTSLVP